MAAAKPTVFPEFAVTDYNNGTGAAPNVVEPSAGKKDTGWDEGERPPRETFNWLHRITNNWVEWFDQVVMSEVFSYDAANSSLLNMAITGGQVVVDGQRTVVAAGSVALAASTVQYVGYEISSGTLVTGISQFQDIDIIPLFRVTTAASSITTVEDQRTPFVTIDPAQASRLNTHQLRTAGKAADMVSFTAGASSATPDMADGNIFHWGMSATGAKTMNNPLNSEALDSNQTQKITFIIRLFDASTTLTWGSEFQFVDDTNNDGALDGANGLDYIVTGVYEPITNVWYCKVQGGVDQFKESGSFTATLSGMISATTGQINWYRIGRQVTLYAPAAITNTSNSTAMVMTGLPADITPTTDGIGRAVTVVTDDGNSAPAQTLIRNTNQIDFAFPDGDWQAGGSFSSIGFSNTGLKGINVGWTFTYTLD